MNTLVVYSHPRRNSLNGAFLDRTLKGLNANPGIDNTDVLDLYAEDFDPRLRFDETRRRRDMHLDPAFEKHRDQLDRADLLVFVYPIWWGRPPAILLGYIDQLFASDFAYKQEPGKMMPTGLFKDKRVICVSTMKGPSGYPALILRNAHKVLMRKAVFNYVGIKDVRFFEFGGMERKDGKQLDKLKKIESYMSGLRTA